MRYQRETEYKNYLPLAGQCHIISALPIKCKCFYDKINCSHDFSFPDSAARLIFSLLINVVTTTSISTCFMKTAETKTIRTVPTTELEQSLYTAYLP